MSNAHPRASTLKGIMWSLLHTTICKHIPHKHKSHSRQGKSSTFNHIKPSKIEGRLKIWGELEELRVAMDSSNKSNGDQPVTQEELQRVVLTLAYALFNPSVLA